jgi:uncharacterized protein YjiS (DUF1127 family)
MTASIITSVPAAAGSAGGPLGSLRQRLRLRAAHRRTRAELSRLSIREREDIGIAGEDMNLVARMAVYGA